MTDDNDLSQESLEIGYTIAEPFSDHILLTYIKWANYGLNLGITISVKGIVYTGKIISGAEWCEKRIQELEISEGSEQVKDMIRDYYNRIKSDLYPSAEEASGKKIGYLHLDEVKVFSVNQMSDFDMCWRFKVGEIDGFSLGKLEPKS